MAVVGIGGQFTRQWVIHTDALAVEANEDVARMVGTEGRDRRVVRLRHMDELLALLAEQSPVGSAHIDTARHVGADAVVLRAVRVVHILFGMLAVIAIDTVLSDYPQPAGIVLGHAAYLTSSLQLDGHLTGSQVLHQQQPVGRGASHQFTILPLQQAVHIAVNVLALLVQFLYIAELHTVVGLQTGVGTEVQSSVGCLCHTQHMVASHSCGILLSPLESLELVAVVLHDAVARHRPQEPVPVDIQLVDEQPRPQMVYIEELTRLRPCCLCSKGEEHRHANQQPSHHFSSPITTPHGSMVMFWPLARDCLSSSDWLAG